jgi:integrase/recombinase XerD
MPKTATEPCTKEEINALIDASVDNDFFYTLFKVAKKTGRRLGEYYNIKVKDIDFDKKTMMTIVLKRRKRVYREALLDDELIHLLKRHIQREGLKLDDYLFRKYHYRHIQNRVTHYAKKAGINHKVSFHNFRHYLITGLIKKGFSYDQVSKITGHGTVGTISVYDHSVASDIRDKAMEAMKEL